MLGLVDLCRDVVLLMRFWRIACRNSKYSPVRSTILSYVMLDSWLW